MTVKEFDKLNHTKQMELFVAWCEKNNKNIRDHRALSEFISTLKA
jgi:hypothetical protein